MKLTKPKKKNIIILSTLSILLLSSISVYFFATPNVSETEQSSFVSDVKESGIKVKRLSKVVNDDGSTTETFSYTISPSNANNQEIRLSTSYIDSTPCSDVIKSSVDVVSKTISITNTGPFDKQIIVKIISLDNESIFCEITIEYEKRILSIEPLWEYSEPYYHTILSTDGVTKDFAIENIFNANYTPFTKDKKYTIELVDIQNFYVSCNKTDINTIVSSASFIEFFRSKLTSYQGAPTAEEYWNASSSNQYHSALANAKNSQTILTVNGTLTYECVEDHNIRKSLRINLNQYLYDIDFTQYAVAVDSISVDLPNNTIIF